MKQYRKISNIVPNSYAEAAEIQVDDILLTVNGEEPRDVIDYLLLTSDEEVELVLEETNGELYEVVIEKEYHEPIGLEFYEPLMDGPKACTNRCVFCFIDQLPEHERDTLYFKDDDWRLSFLVGNYVTLSNLKAEEVDRIIAARVSPLNISVHATDIAVRTKLLGHKKEQDIMAILKKFNEAHIEMKCQVVLCPGWNDGKILEQTIRDLSQLVMVESLSIVPVGLTQHREKLTNIQPVSKEKANEVIDQVEKWQATCLSQRESHFVYASDEFYIKAEREIPGYETYENYSQYENGVGIVAKFLKECYDAIDCVNLPRNRSEVVALVGVSAEKFLINIMGVLSEKIGQHINVACIENHHFGESITVTGLICGEDIIQQLQGSCEGKTIIIPDVMLRERKDTLLDNMTIAEIENALHAEIKVVSDGTELIYAIAK